MKPSEQALISGVDPKWSDLFSLLGTLVRSDIKRLFRIFFQCFINLCFSFPVEFHVHIIDKSCLILIFGVLSLLILIYNYILLNCLYDEHNQ